MDILTEVHNEGELTRAINMGAEIIGINNRNLRDLTVSLEATRRLSPLIPKDRLVVSESGYQTRADVLENTNFADAFLIGSALMATADIEAKINELVTDQVKVCGLTNIKDATLAADLGARYGGIILTPHSPRCVSQRDAKKITREKRLDYIGVFLDQNLIEVAEMAHALKLNGVQLHGRETSEYRIHLKKLLPRGCKIIQAYRVENTLPVNFPEGADFVLFDTFSKTLRGGTGKAFNWEMLEDYPHLDKVFLSGGLSVGNIKSGLEHGTMALDVNSQLEERPGVKCHVKMHAFFKNLKPSPRSKAKLEMAS